MRTMVRPGVLALGIMVAAAPACMRREPTAGDPGAPPGDPPPAGTLPVADPADVDRYEAIEEVLERAGDPRATFEMAQGELRRLVLHAPAEALGLPADEGPDVAARAFLDTWAGPLLRLDEPLRDLALFRRSGERARTYRLRQHLAGLPVWGAEVQLTLDVPDDGPLAVEGLLGHYVPDLSVAALVARMAGPPAPLAALQAAVLTEEGVDPADYVAETIGDRAARLHPRPVSDGGSGEGDVVTITDASLWVFDAALLAPECPSCPAVEHDPRLTWRIRYASPENGGAGVDLFVDVATAEVLHRDIRVTDLDIDVETANNSGPSRNCWRNSNSDDAWFDEDGLCRFMPFGCVGNACADGWGCPDPSQEGWDLYNFTVEMDRYLTHLGWDSFDDDDGEYEMYAHAGFTTPNARAMQCGWPDYPYHEFANGMVVLDIVAHEIGHSTHRVATGGFVYQNQSGAVVEHVADIFGVGLGDWSTTYPDPDWLEGEGSSAAGACGAVRDLAAPPNCGGGGCTLGPDPDDNANFQVLPLTCDNGGVHVNSTILSKAAWLFTAGGTHNGRAVSGIGWPKSRHLLWRTVRDRLGSNPTFLSYRNAVVAECDAMAGAGLFGMEAADCCAVRNGFAQVTLGNSDWDCDGIEDNNDLDLDADGVADVVDLCPGVRDPSNLDTDGDGLGDPCDPDDDGDGVPDGTDADWETDSDRDGIVDALDTPPSFDNCRLVPNPGQVDSDGDRAGDLCDDGDGDGIIDINDVCPTVRDSAQLDLDGDGVGDACDDDVDGDGVLDAVDLCPRIADPAQGDRDQDGVGDVCDGCPLVSDPRQSDRDLDGVGDACDLDRDGDGIANDEDACPDRWGEFCEEGRELRPDGRAFLLDAVEALRGGGGQRPWLPSMDACALVDCAWSDWGDDGRSLQAELTLGRDFPTSEDPSGPVEVWVALVDRSGEVLARARREVSREETDVTIDLDAGLPPLFGAFPPVEDGGALAPLGELARVAGQPRVQLQVGWSGAEPADLIGDFRASGRFQVVEP